VGEDSDPDAVTTGAVDPGAVEATDVEDPDAGDANEHDSLRFDRWRKRSATGAVLTGVALGLQHALDRPKQEPAIVVEASGEPEDDDAPFVVHLDPDDPSRTVVVVREDHTGPPDPPTTA
jgi:hypothetical protein